VRSRQVGARTFAAPQWSNLKPRAGFCAGIPNRIRESTLNNLEFMKTTPQISHNRNSGFPVTDYNFQATGDPESSCSNVYPAKKSPPFHRLSSEFFGAEESRHHLVEFSAFTVLGLITAWPIMSMLIAVTRLVY